MEEEVNHGKEVVEICLYNDDGTKLNVEISRLKDFAPLGRIPRARTADWRRAYERALKDI